MSVQISTGPGSPQPDGTETPGYATPGSITASVGGTFTCTSAGTTLTVGTVLGGALWPGDAVSGGDGTNALPAGTVIQSQISGTAGGAGTYLLNQVAVPGNLGACTVTAISDVLTVTGQTSGLLLPGQALAGRGLLPGTNITAQLSGPLGGIGLYSLNQIQTAVVTSTTMATQLSLVAQIQPITWRDLQQMDGVNLGGVRWKCYLNGEVDAIVRPEKKGGDLVVIPSGRHAGTWLVVQVLEQFPDWVCAAIVLQSSVVPSSGGLSTDLTNPDNVIVVPLILTGV